MGANGEREPKKNVLLTGATGTIGRQVAQTLYHDPNVGRLVCVARDSEPYYFHDYDRIRFQFKQLDILKARELHNFVLSALFREASIDTVVHLAFVNRPRDQGLATHTLNVEGTKNLLYKCIEIGHIRKFVFQSSDAVYKLRPSNPALLDEEADLNFDHDASQYVKDRVDADMICRSQLLNPGVRIIILRPSSIIGRNVHSRWNALLENHRLIFKVLGFDPMICPIHANDVIRAIQHAVHRDVQGVFNITGLDWAPLSTFIRLAGANRLSLPALALRAVNGLQQALRLTQYDYDDQPEAMRHACLLDTTRARDVLGFTPQYHIKFA